MAGHITSSSFAKDLLPGVQKYFGMAYKDWDTKYDKIFEVEKVSERYAEDIIGRGLGLASRKEEGDGFAYDTMSEGWLKRYEQVVYGGGFIITREARDDGHALNIAKEGARSAKKSILQTIENVNANHLNRAFTSGYTGGDGVVLCSTAHTTYTGGNVSNRAAVDSDLSEASLEQSRIDISAFVDERGLKAYVQPRKLVIPTALCYEAKRILGNPMRPATSDRDINALYAYDTFPGGMVENPYLTDTDAWFVLTDCEKGLRHLVRDEMEITNDNDFDTENAKYKYRIRFTSGWSDYRCIYGTPGA